MPSWKYFSNEWQEWIEQLADGSMMHAYRHPDGYDYDVNSATGMPGGWVYVYPRGEMIWDRDVRYLEANRLERGVGWLEIECTMHDTRKRYGGAE
jgi:hypothetical protein